MKLYSSVLPFLLIVAAVFGLSRFLTIDPPTPQGSLPPKQCIVSGCSSELCVDSTKPNDGISTCMYRKEYSCYANTKAKCEIQPDKTCGWTQTNELKSCIEDARTNPL